MNRKAPAFTLLELTISMVLMSILVAIGYYGYEVIQKQSGLWQKRTTERAEQLFFLTRINEDILEAETCHYDFNTLSVLCKQTSHEVSYVFSEMYVIRKGHRTDTIDVVVSNVSPHFLEGKHVDELLVDFLGLEMTYLDTTMYIPIRKWYATQTLLEYGY